MPFEVVGESPQSPFDTEILRFLALMDSKDFDGETDPLVFWGDIAEEFPILSRLAAKSFASSACAADVERLFSHAGDVCESDRSRLSGHNINILTTLNCFYRRINKKVQKVCRSSRNSMSTWSS